MNDSRDLRLLAEVYENMEDSVSDSEEAVPNISSDCTIGQIVSKDGQKYIVISNQNGSLQLQKVQIKPSDRATITVDMEEIEPLVPAGTWWL